MVLNSRIAAAFLAEVNGTQDRKTQCSDDLEGAITWLESVAREPIQRGPNALSPQSAAALLSAYRRQVPPPLFDGDAWIGLSWIANRYSPRPISAHPQSFP